VKVAAWPALALALGLGMLACPSTGGGASGGEPPSRPKLHVFEQLVWSNLEAAGDVHFVHEDAWPLVHLEPHQPDPVTLLYGGLRLGEGIAALAVGGLDRAGGRVEDERVDGPSIVQAHAAREVLGAERLVAAELDLVRRALDDLELDVHAVRGGVPR